MLFNSKAFFLFFPLVCLLYFCFPQRYRWALLLAASYYFYMAWKAEYILLIILSTLIDYFVSLRMSALDTKEERKPWLWVSLSSNLIILFTFKYYNFFAEKIRELISMTGSDYLLPISDLILPMGISFYTFQTMAYSIDVYQGSIKAEKHLGYFALYVTYFPQLVAGPIERAENLLHQFRTHYRFEYARASQGLKQMLWGFFKKVVIADGIGVFVDHAYTYSDQYDGLTMGLATFLFAFQIYCDFSGYSDIAIGAARIMGVNLMENFRTPYLSQNISEFWSRWHISLSTWFRDYLYIPLGGNRVVKWRWYYNLMIVFLVSGFWHGANWTYIIWGALHGIYLVSAIFFKEFNSKWTNRIGLSEKPQLKKTLNISLTFILALIAWIFFRSDSFEQAMDVVRKIGGMQFDLSLFEDYITRQNVGKFISLLAVLGAFILLDPWMDDLIKGRKSLSSGPSMLVFACIVVAIMLFGNFGEVNFIYFQF